MTKISDSVVWLTGASSGIGEALAYELSNLGARLILSARRKEELERVKGNCRQDQQNNIQLLPLDITQSKTMPLSLEAALQFFEKIDILINCAGVGQRSMAKDTTEEAELKIFKTNYFGNIAMTKTMLPYFLERRKGHIVTITSVTGIFGTPLRSTYAASKHALHGYLDSLRAELYQEVQESIPVTIIAPGFIQTNHIQSSITADGSPLGESDSGYYKRKSPTWCAKKICKAIEKNKQEVYIGGKEIWGVYIKRFFPTTFAKIVRKAKVS